jgi:hypothetical protein
MLTIQVVIVGNSKLQLRFFLAKTPLNLLPNFVVDLINIPFVITFMLGTTIVSTPMVVIFALND